MLYATKRELHAELAKDILEVRQRELNYYTTNINNIGQQAALLSGFAFTTLASHESRSVLSWIDDYTQEPFVVLTFALQPQQQMQVLLELFYLTSTISAMGSTLYTLYICLISTILGPGLALRGPEGSVDRAVLGLARVNRKVIQSFAFALNLFQFSILVNSFINFHVIAAVVCMVFNLYYMWTITKYGNSLTREFFIDPTNIVTGRFEPSGEKDQDDLFPSTGDRLKKYKNTLAASAAGGKKKDPDYDPANHKPSAVAGHMMYDWQGPLPEEPEEMANDILTKNEKPMTTWFNSLFGADAAKPAPHARETVRARGGQVGQMKGRSDASDTPSAGAGSTDSQSTINAGAHTPSDDGSVDGGDGAKDGSKSGARPKRPPAGPPPPITVKIGSKQMAEI